MFDRSKLAACAFFAVAGLASPAFATVVFDWSYTGSGISANGTFDTTLNSPGIYLITSLTGQRNGLTITSLDPSFGFSPDQLLYYPATDTGTDLTPTFLDSHGFSYDIGTTAYTVFTSNKSPTVLEVDSGGGFGPVTFSATEVTNSVPEPASGALLAAALAGFGLILSRRKRA